MEMLVQLLRAIKIKAVAEKELLGFRVGAVLAVMRDDLFASFVRVAAVMANARKVVYHGAVEIEQEQICVDGIGERSTVVALVLVVPVFHGVVIGVSKRN